MRKLVILALWSLGYVSLSVCDTGSKETAVADAANCFTIKFHKEVRSDNGNTASSPFSAYCLLALLREGAGGVTRQELDKALELETSTNASGAFHSLLSKLVSSHGNTLNIANSIWSQKSFPVLQTFNDIATNNFNSEIHSVDFSKNSKDAVQQINNWVKIKTAGMIDKLLDTLDPATVMTLVNTVLLNATWERTFSARNSGNQPFFNLYPKNQTSSVKMMNQRSYFNYGESNILKAKMLEMKYVGGDLSMIIILPDRDSNMTNLIDNLTWSSLNKELMSLHSSTSVDVTIPVFDSSSQLDLVGALQRVGIKDAFQDRADFSGINSGIKLSKAVQKCVVKVNERGTEAAAATAMIMLTKSAMVYRDVKYFTANRPFVYLIRDNRTGMILFIGEINQL